MKFIGTGVVWHGDRALCRFVNTGRDEQGNITGEFTTDDRKIQTVLLERGYKAVDEPKTAPVIATVSKRKGKETDDTEE